MLYTHLFFNKKRLSLIILLIGFFFLASCSYIRPHRIDIQQGNIIEQEKVNQLKIGMRKDQVQFVLGTSMLMDVFHSNRWDYIHTMKNGHNKMEKKHIVMYFKDDKLIKIMGDINPGDISTNKNKNDSISVPLENAEEDDGKSWVNKMMWWKDDETEKKAPREPQPNQVNHSMKIPEIMTEEKRN